MQDILARLPAHFDLHPVTSASEVSGGLSNALYRVETSAGAYAVKIMGINADSHDFQNNIENAFAVEQAAFTAGVPCPEPVPTSQGTCLAAVAGKLVRVHHWVEGVTPAITPESGRWAGELLAKIHSIEGHVDLTLDDDPSDESGWTSLANTPGLNERLECRLRAAAPALADLERLTAAPGQLAAHVSAHGDLDPKNTLLDPSGRLLALDWDSAGRQPVLRDVVTIALDWSTTPSSFRGVVDAYEAASEDVRVPAKPWVFGGWVVAHSGWLVHNATRRAGSALGSAEVSTTCDRLLRLHANLPVYVEALSHR